MKNRLRSRAALAAETVLLLVVVLGGAGFFGVREVKRAFQDHRTQNALEKAEKSATDAHVASTNAMSERDRANEALAAAKKDRDATKAREVEIGRTIQRSTAQAAAAASQLPESPQRQFLFGRFVEIDSASNLVFGAAPTRDAEVWRETALAALAGNREAQARIDQQKDEIARLGRELAAARAQQAATEKRAEEYNQKATEAQRVATAAAGQARANSTRAVEAFGDRDTWKTLANGLMLIVAAVGGLWLLGAGLKMFAVGQGEGRLANGLHTAADTLHSFLAPMSVLSQAHARRDAEKLVDSTGGFMADVRTKLPPEMAEKITDLMDIAMSPKNQNRIRNACLQRATTTKKLAVDALAVATTPR